MTTIPHPLDETVEDDQKRAAFRVNDDGAAAWAMQRLSEIRMLIAEKERFAQAEHDRITIWLTGEVETLQTRGAYFVNLLEDYARREREDKDRKSVALPHGKVSTRWTQPKFNINDDLFVPWAEQNAPELLRVKKEPSLTEMRERLVIQDGALIHRDLGCVVEGARAAAAELSITIKTEGEKQ